MFRFFASSKSGSCDRPALADRALRRPDADHYPCPAGSRRADATNTGCNARARADESAADAAKQALTDATEAAQAVYAGAKAVQNNAELEYVRAMTRSNSLAGVLDQPIGVKDLQPLRRIVETPDFVGFVRLLRDAQTGAERHMALAKELADAQAALNTTLTDNPETKQNKTVRQEAVRLKAQIVEEAKRQNRRLADQREAIVALKDAVRGLPARVVPAIDARIQEAGKLEEGSATAHITQQIQLVRTRIGISGRARALSDLVFALLGKYDNETISAVADADWRAAVVTKRDALTEKNKDLGDGTAAVDRKNRKTAELVGRAAGVIREEIATAFSADADGNNITAPGLNTTQIQALIDKGDSLDRDLTALVAAIATLSVEASEPVSALAQIDLPLLRRTVERLRDRISGISPGFVTAQVSLYYFGDVPRLM